MTRSVDGQAADVGRLSLLVAALAAAIAGCGDRGRVPDLSEGEVDVRVETLTRSGLEPLYWAGRSVAGLPLTDAVAGRPGEATFLYGTCELPEGEGGCGVPIEIQQFPFRARDWRAAAGCTRRPPVRGVTAVHHDTLVLFTGSRAVKIYAAQPRRIALALRPLQGGGAGRPLPRTPAAVVRIVEQVCR